MEFKNYCLVVLGKVDRVKDEISKISETPVRYVDAKGIVIATFSTVATVGELKEFFILNNRSFLLFELNDNVSGVNLTNKAIHDHLFTNIGDPELLKTMSTQLMNEIENSIGNNGKVPELITSGKSQTSLVRQKKTEFDRIDVSNLSIVERDKMINALLEKGAENLTETDKIILDKISKPLKKH